jgi:hypothetical protein
MTSAIRRAAGGLLVLESAWSIYIQLVAAPVFVQQAAAPVACSLNVCPGFNNFNPVYSQAILALAAILIIDGLLGIWGSWFSYPIGASLSGILFAVMGYSALISSGYAYLVGEYYQTVSGAGLASLALIVNLIAWRSKNVLAEQANPMNLPVFG